VYQAASLAGELCQRRERDVVHWGQLHMRSDTGLPLPSRQSSVSWQEGRLSNRTNGAKKASLTVPRTLGFSMR
jgi:hypothetical protein